LKLGTPFLVNIDIWNGIRLWTSFSSLDLKNWWLLKPHMKLCVAFHTL